jgi:hypothetical protein
MAKAFALGLLSLLAFVAAGGAAFSQATPTGGPTPSPPGAAVYFVDPKNGDTIPPKLTIHFGLHGMGVAPAGSEKENSGHHHLLIDTELPPLDQPIPNDFNHLHFGAGQTEAEIQLTPGPHTLQLLFGDKNHVPHSPPLVSERIRVIVAETATVPTPAAAPGGAAAGRHKSPPGAKVYFEYPADRGRVPLKATIRFGLVNMGVAPAGVEKANSGHHHLLIDTPLPPLDQPIPSDPDHLHFGGGQTQATVTLTPGRHTLQLLLGDANHVPHDPPVFSKQITVFAGAVVHHKAKAKAKRKHRKRPARR